ncbi:MAG: hypothetical protein GEU71_12110 [Actinobacteria bacterium]|nr:hypothetical protein [Actinomycetota bacterium]
MKLEVRYVEWVDSCGSSGWEPLDEARKTRPLSIHTVGYVLGEDADYVTIIQSYDERQNGQPHGDHHISIPKVAVKTARTISKARG